MSHAKALTIFYNNSRSYLGGDDEVSTTTIRLQTSVGTSIRLYLKAYIILKRRSGVVIEY